MKIYIVERAKRFDTGMFETETHTEIIKYFTTKEAAISFIENISEETDPEYDYTNCSYFWFERELEG